MSGLRARGIAYLARCAAEAAGQRICGLGSSNVGALVQASSKLSLNTISGASPSQHSSTRGFHSSLLSSAEGVAPYGEANPPTAEPQRKYRPLVDKELWHEAWMYEDKFGTETDPIWVPSLENERIIGVTDPEDDNLVIWGILKANEPPRQLVEGGEFYVLNVVPYVTKVGDVLEQIEASKGAEPALER